MIKRKTIILASDLSVSINPNEKPIISNINLDIKHGDLVFITGDSGSGKSSILKTMYGELSNYSGSLKVANLDLSNIKKSQLQYLRRHMGIMFQNHQFIDSWSVEKNIVLPLRISNKSLKDIESSANKLLNDLNLIDKKSRYPEELSTLDKQLLSFGRSIINRPPIVFMDDPIGNLDDKSSQKLWSLIESFYKALNITFIIFSHKLPENLTMKYKHFSIEDGKFYEVN